MPAELGAMWNQVISKGCAGGVTAGAKFGDRRGDGSDHGRSESKFQILLHFIIQIL